MYSAPRYSSLGIATRRATNSLLYAADFASRVFFKNSFCRLMSPFNFFYLCGEFVLRLLDYVLRELQDLAKGAYARCRRVLRDLEN